MALLPGKKLADWSSDDLIVALKSVLDPKLADAKIAVGDLSAKVILLEAMLASTQAKVEQLEARLAAR